MEIVSESATDIACIIAFQANLIKAPTTPKERELLQQILMHTREGAKEISEYEIMYMLGLLI